MLSNPHMQPMGNWVLAVVPACKVNLGSEVRQSGHLRLEEALFPLS